MIMITCDLLLELRRRGMEALQAISRYRYPSPNATLRLHEEKDATDADRSCAPPDCLAGSSRD
jgi:hypothetical protein